MIAPPIPLPRGALSDPEATLPPNLARVRRRFSPDCLRHGTYLANRLIGAGSMGVVLAAVDRTSARPVAMKVMVERGDRDDARRFIEEARLTRSLDHPNVVPVYDLGVNEHDQVFYTMKLIDGISLRAALDLLRAGDRDTVAKYSLRFLVTVFLKVCDAIAFAHHQGVLHRDLKPDNIMLGRFGEVFVVDWGLARLLDEATPAPRERTGTPSHMAPEQLRGDSDRIDRRSDIFSLGVILHQILTLALPGAAAPAARPAPPALTAIAAKALSAEPADRYQSVWAMQRDIETW